MEFGILFTSHPNTDTEPYPDRPNENLLQLCKGADMVILNTCHIREKAAEKVFSELGRLRRLQEATLKLRKGLLMFCSGHCRRPLQSAYRLRAPER